MSTALQTQQRGKSFPVAMKVVTVKDLIQLLHRYAKQREYAYNRYCNHSTAMKIEAIADIYELLSKAADCLSDKEACKLILKTALDFHFIAPTGNRKEYADWYLKVEDVMEACRHYLGWRKQ